MRSWPELGERLTEYVYGGKIDHLFGAARRESPARQAEIAIDLRRAARFDRAEEPLLLTVGSGNAENILQLPGNFEVGQKHVVSVNELQGGSGVNHSLRLLAAGFDVFPILPIGNDAIGHKLRDSFVDAAARGRVNERVTRFLNPDPLASFFDPNISTPASTVIVDGKHRTILSQELRHGERFVEHLDRRAGALTRIEPKGPSALMIGHLHSDGTQLKTRSDRAAVRLAC